MTDIHGAPKRKVWPLGGYAPGGYMGKCRDCGEELIAEKRAYQCLECAVVSANARISLTESTLRHVTDSEGRLRIALWNELRRKGVSDDVAIKLIREAAQGTPTRSAETTGSVCEADGGPVAKPCAQGDPA